MEVGQIPLSIMPRRIIFSTLFSWTLVLSYGSLLAQFPMNGAYGTVRDYAGILSEDEQFALSLHLRKLTSGVDPYGIIILPTLPETASLDRYAYVQLRQWNPTKQFHKTGILLVLVVDRNEAALAIGSQHEGLVTMRNIAQAKKDVTQHAARKEYMLGITKGMASILGVIDAPNTRPNYTLWWAIGICILVLVFVGLIMNRRG